MLEGADLTAAVATGVDADDDVDADADDDGDAEADVVDPEVCGENLLPMEATKERALLT